MKKIISLILYTRSKLNRWLYPSDKYFLATRKIKPLSRKFGFDRGTPIDRFWIEKFLSQNSQFITGKCLEVTDNKYTQKYGHSITVSDVLDIDTKNKKANIFGDLRNLKNIKSNTYNTVILTHVLGLIDDYEAVIRESKRILKTGGHLLVTVATLCPTFYQEGSFWRFTPASAKYIFSKYFSPKSLKITSFGNALTGQCFWVGMAQEELTQKELDYDDPLFPCVVGIRAQK